MSDKLDFLGSFAEGDYPADFLTDYELLECLGTGAEGETLYVRRRRDSLYGVAKCARDTPLLADEGTILEKLHHPGLPRFLDRYQTDAVRCIVREYISGTTLDRLGIAEEKEATAIAVQLCDILTYLHSQSPPVIHRDIKPQNVVMKQDGTVFLIDFGISRTYSEQAQTDTVCFGTKPFAPPEQYGFAQTDARADLFSLGVLLRFLLTGNTAADHKLQNKRLEKVLKKCTDFAPSRRYPSTEAVKKAILRADPVRSVHKKHFCYIAIAWVLALAVGFSVGRFTDFLRFPDSGVTFAEPLIEQAARTMLGFDEKQPITRGDLEQVTELYVAGKTPCAGETDFYNVMFGWYNNGHNVERGGIKSLADLTMMPNLMRLGVMGEVLEDIAPLASCRKLIKLELKHNYVADLSPLEHLEKLQYVGFVDNPIQTLAPLAGKPDLTVLDLNGVSTYDGASLGALTSGFQTLNICDNDTAYLYLDGKHIQELNINGTTFHSMDSLSRVTGLSVLDIGGCPIANLSGIEVHTALVQLNLAGTAVRDLTPLLTLPNLVDLTLDEEQRTSAAVLNSLPNLIIHYQ